MWSTVFPGDMASVSNMFKLVSRQARPPRHAFAFVARTHAFSTSAARWNTSQSTEAPRTITMEDLEHSEEDDPQNFTDLSTVVAETAETVETMEPAVPPSFASSLLSSEYSRELHPFM